MENKLITKRNEVFTGEYRTIPFEIKWTYPIYSEEFQREVNAICSGMLSKSMLAAYIYIRRDLVSEEIFNKFKCKTGKWATGIKYFKYSNNNYIMNLPIHCGCTYLDMPNENCYKLGWDYNHYWDEGRTYSNDYIVNEIVELIDAILGEEKVKNEENTNNQKS